MPSSNYPILKTKVDYPRWRKAIAFCSFNSLPLYQCKDEIDSQSLTNLCSYIFSLSQEVLNRLQGFQLQEKESIFNLSVLSGYVLELFKAKEDAKLEKDIRKIDDAIKRLDELSLTFIDGYYLPQVSMDDTYHRLYYHPIYSFKEKAIRKLFTGGLVKQPYKVYKVDINGALIRTAYKYLYTFTTGEDYLKVAETKKDVYQFLMHRDGITGVDRSVFKDELIKLINQGKPKPGVISARIKEEIALLHTILPNLNILRKYMTIYCLNRLIEVQNGNYGFFFFINMDGGIFISKEEIRIEEIPSYKVLKVEKLQ